MLIYAIALFVGLLLGLLGGGGGIVTVPTLVYLGGMGVKQAVAHAIPIVGGITLYQAIREIRAGRVRWRGTLAFALSSMAGTYLGARLAVTWIPEKLLILILTSVILAAAIIMMRNALKSKNIPKSILKDNSPWRGPLLIAIGLVTGALSGMVGVGGGFMMVPALSLIAGFPMTVAVGTNLVIIATKSAFGVIGYLNDVAWDIKIILIFIGGGIFGSYLGARLRLVTSERGLKLTFASFLILMSLMLLVDRYFKA